MCVLRVKSFTFIVTRFVTLLTGQSTCCVSVSTQQWAETTNTEFEKRQLSQELMQRFQKASSIVASACEDGPYGHASSSGGSALRNNILDKLRQCFWWALLIRISSHRFAWASPLGSPLKQIFASMLSLQCKITEVKWFRPFGCVRLKQHSNRLYDFQPHLTVYTIFSGIVAHGIGFLSLFGVKGDWSWVGLQ